MKVGPNKYKCIVMEGTIKSSNGSETAKWWLCDDFPGALIKMESSGTSGDMKVSRVSTAVDMFLPTPAPPKEKTAK